MSNPALFGVGSIVFIFATWATLMFLYWRFNEIYRTDQDAIAENPDITAVGSREPQSAAEGVEV